MLGQWLIGVMIGCTCAADLPRERFEKTDADKKVSVRVGVFKRQEVLVAFYHSKFWNEQLRELVAQSNKARADGDDTKVKELEAKGAALQAEVHRQLMGKAPLTNILNCLKDALPGVAKEANVQLIVEEPLYRDSSVETVDITSLLLNRLPPVDTKGKSKKTTP